MVGVGFLELVNHSLIALSPPISQNFRMGLTYTLDGQNTINTLLFSLRRGKGVELVF